MNEVLSMRRINFFSLPATTTQKPDSKTNEISFKNEHNFNHAERFIYFLSINNQVLEVIGKHKMQPILVNIAIYKNNRCFFYINEIKNNTLYNKFIKLSGNYRVVDLIDDTDTSVQYPFYIITPFTIPGYAIRIQKNKLELKPIRNDTFQQFSKILNPSSCRIRNTDANDNLRTQCFTN